MSRPMKLFVLAAIVAMAGVFAAFAWMYRDPIAHLQTLAPAQRNLLVRALIALAFAPAWTGLGAFAVSRQFAQRGIRLTVEHRRFYEASMVVAVLFIMAAQAWIAFGTAHTPVADRELVTRGVLVFCGVFAAVYGNFHAKAAPPSGELAPAPAVWIRGMLRNGWAMVLLGLAIIVLAIVLPFRLLPFLTLAMVAAAVPIWRSQFRLMWPSRKPPASA